MAAWLSGLTINHNHIIKPLNVKYAHTPVMEKLYAVTVMLQIMQLPYFIILYSLYVSTHLIPISNPGNLTCGMHLL